MKQTSTPAQLEYNTVFIRTARPSDIEDVGDNMRQMDKMECLLHSGVGPRDAIRRGFETDFHTWTICSKETKKPLACFGIGPVPAHDFNYIWMLCTDDLLEVTGREFVKASKAWVTFLVNHYNRPCMNEVYIKNTLAMRWLKWCGATFNEPDEKEFSLFTITPND